MTSAPDEGLVDAGAQAERTVLAWSRLLLALAANGALLVRAASHTGLWAAVAGLTVAVLSVALWAVAETAYVRGRGRPVHGVLPGRATLGITVMVAGVGTADLVAVLTFG